MRSVEQICRDLLELAIIQGLVQMDPDWSNPDPHARTAGELIRVANLLRDYMGEREARIKDLESGLADAAKRLCDMCEDGLPVTEGRHEVQMDEGEPESYPCDAREIWELLQSKKGEIP